MSYTYTPSEGAEVEEGALATRFVWQHTENVRKRSKCHVLNTPLAAGRTSCSVWQSRIYMYGIRTGLGPCTNYLGAASSAAAVLVLVPMLLGWLDTACCRRGSEEARQGEDSCG